NPGTPTAGKARKRRTAPALLRDTGRDVCPCALGAVYGPQEPQGSVLGSQVENTSFSGKPDAGLLPVQEKHCEVCRTARYAKLYGLQKAAGEGFDHRRVPVPDRPE